MIKREILTQNSKVLEVVGTFKEKYTVATDSRTLLPRDIFVALDGPVYRGISFLKECLAKGVHGFVVNRDEQSIETVEKLREKNTIAVIYVQNTLDYLQEIALLHLSEWKKKGGVLIGLTGSNGKTTCKEMLVHIFESLHGKEKVHGTHKNLNNHIGVPLTTLALEDRHRFGIVEMGTNRPGEIKKLCQTAPPDCGFITNIGDGHLEFLGNRKGVFEEKRALFDAVKTGGGPFVVNQDDTFLQKLSGGQNSLSYGLGGKNIEFALTKGGLLLKMSWGETLEIKNKKINGDFNYFNLGMCVSLALALFENKKEEIVEAANSFVPPHNNRATWIERDGKKFFLDAYNANPTSMQAALQFFMGHLGPDTRPLFVVGDMNELGENTGEFHKRIGRFLREKGCRGVVFVGQYASFYRQGFGKGAVCYQNTSRLREFWPEHLKESNIFFIKGSRTLQLESLLDIK